MIERVLVFIFSTIIGTLAFIPFTLFITLMILISVAIGKAQPENIATMYRDAFEDAYHIRFSRG